MSQNARKPGTRSKRISVEVSVIVALIGFVATISAALINYCSSRYPIEQSLKSTQKAEENFARFALAATSANSQPTAIALPPATVPPTPTETATSEPSPLPTETESPIDWQTIFNIQTTWQPCGYHMIPTYINLNAGMEKAAAQVDEAYMSREYDKWEIGPSGNSILLFMDITNISPDVEWIRLSKSASVSVHAISKVPENIIMADTHGCGGGGMYREFPIGSLASSFKSYEFEVTYPDPEVDFFTLEQGEFESFIFNFECTAPGIYELEIHIPFSQKGMEGEIVYADRQRLICPLEYSGYEYLSSFDSANGAADLRFEGTFTWNGTEYVVKP